MTIPNLTVGQTLWYVPRRGPTQEVTIEKIGRRWATLAPHWCGRIDITTLAVDGGQYTSPAQCYLSEGAYTKWRADRELWFLFKRLLDRTAMPQGGAQAIRQAAALLGLELEGVGEVMAGPPQRIQRRRTKGWRMPEGAVCVDRTTPFGNPFPITKGKSTSAGQTKPIWQVGSWDGPAIWFCDTPDDAAERSVRAFRAWISQPQQATLREKARLVLRGKTLACWCSTDRACHADVLISIANTEL